MDEKKNITNITTLAQVFLETLKEVSKSGNVLNPTTLSQFLAKKKIIKDLLKLANKAQKEEIRIKKKVELKEIIQSLDETEDEKKKNVLNIVVETEMRLDNEKDFNKRFTLMLLNMYRIPGNEPFIKLFDEYKQLLIDEADIESREKAFNSIKNQMLKEDFNTHNGTVLKDEINMEVSKPRPSVLRRILGDSSEINLKTLKKTCLKAIEELQSVMGNELTGSISLIKDRINICESIDYLFSLRKQIIEIIGDYIEQTREEKAQVTVFIKEIGKKLIEIERDLLIAFTNSNQLLEDDYKFSDKLEVQIKDIGKIIESAKEFEELKKIIITELTSLTNILDDKRREYTARLEESNIEKEKIQEHFEKIVSDVIEENEILLERNQKDHLTGIYNRVTFEESIVVEFERFKRYMDPFSVIMFDIDYFKNVNDTYGHEAGDRVLKGVAKSVGGILRKTDVFARYGGEEFIILLIQTDLEKGLKVANKLRKIVQKTEFLYEGNKVTITVSVGITEATPSDTEYKTVFNRVDSYMYKAKESGRNTVISDFDIDS